MPMTSNERAFWRRLCDKFEQLRGDLESDIYLGAACPAKGSFVQILIAHDKQVHYEWAIRGTGVTRYLDTALHFECPRREASLAWLKLFEGQLAAIQSGIDFDFHSGACGEKCAEMYFRIPFQGAAPSMKHADDAAETMVQLIDRTFDVLSGNLDLPRTRL
jgi:hypothetical protein